MATTIFRFVDTTSSPGGDGTTDATAGANRAYSSLSEWEAAEQADLVSLDQIMDVSCAGGADLVNVTISGWTTGALNYILIHSTTDKHANSFDASKYHFSGTTASGGSLIVSEEFVRIEDLQLDKITPVSGGAARVMIRGVTLGAGDIRFNRNIFRYDSNDIAGSVSMVALDDSSPSYTIQNNIFDNRLAGGGTSVTAILGSGGSASPDIYNNTFINWPVAINSKANYLCKNNIFQDSAVDINGTLNASNDYNLTDNISIAGANSVDNSTLTFENKASFNFALVSGDTDAIGAGIGPSSDANVPLDDVIGTARSGATTDIGAFVFVGGSGVTVTPSTINSASVSNNPAITFNSVVNLAPNAIDSLSVANNPSIQFGSVLNISPATIDSASVSNDPILSFSAVLNITPQAIDSVSAPNDPSILFNSVLSLTPSTIDSLSVSNNPVIEFKSVINVLPQTIDSLSVSNNPFISFGVVQTIGNVTASFKDSGISVKYEEDEINVGYKPNAIIVNFK